MATCEVLASTSPKPATSSVREDEAGPAATRPRICQLEQSDARASNPLCMCWWASAPARAALFDGGSCGARDSFVRFDAALPSKCESSFGPRPTTRARRSFLLVKGRSCTIWVATLAGSPGMASSCAFSSAALTPLLFTVLSSTIARKNSRPTARERRSRGVAQSRTRASIHEGFGSGRPHRLGVGRTTLPLYIIVHIWR